MSILLHKTQRLIVKIIDRLFDNENIMLGAALVQVGKKEGRLQGIQLKIQFTLTQRDIKGEKLRGNCKRHKDRK